MDTFRKWWNKPKADDKSILARFYYADRALTAVASELDSFDGRAEPERCSRLVGRLRQGQDQVLAITNIIMDELLGEDRAARAFRAKFPEEVLQESLAGQLWFGAECLAAGSSIMNREMESAEMRPLAKAVTKSLDHVRNLLREQCLRNKTPNSLTLNLDLNDAITETLCESLKIFDRLFAEFEFLYVSAMVQVKTKQEHEMQELICVLFSETLQRALRLGLLEQEQVDYFDPALMFSIPRLAIVTGLVIYTKGPLNMSMPADQLSEMFRPFRTLLIKIRDLLRTLNANELHQLEKLLCTNEDIHIIQPKEVVRESTERYVMAPDEIRTKPLPNQRHEQSDDDDEDDEDDDDADDDGEENAMPVQSQHNVSTASSSASSSDPELDTNVINSDVYRTRIDVTAAAPESTSIDAAANRTEFHYDDTAPSTATGQPHINVWTNDTTLTAMMDTAIGTDSTQDDKDDVNQLVTADCASGYLIPNTNFGNLLQTTDTPLTDSFISSDDEYTQKLDRTVADVNDDSTLGEHADITTMMDKDAILAMNEVATATIPGLDSEIARSMRHTENGDSGVGTAENTSSDHTPETETNNLIIATSTDNQVTVSVGCSSSSSGSSRHNEHSESSSKAREKQSVRRRAENVSVSMVRPTIVPVGAQHHHHHHYHHHHHHSRSASGQHNPMPPQCQHNASSMLARLPKSHASRTGSHSTKAAKENVSTRYRRRLHCTSYRGHHHGNAAEEKISISSTSSIYSDGAVQDVALAHRTSGRMKFKSTENLLHRLFVCIAGVADQLQTNFASDLRQILRSVFLMNTTPPPEEVEIKITEKTKDSTSDLFEFRASENDVIQENDGGSNHSIYSAEEVNPESDSVFEHLSSGQTSSSSSSSTSSSVERQERSASLETEIRITTNRVNVERSRSLGEDSSSPNQTSHPVSVVVTISNNCRHHHHSNVKDMHANSPTSALPIHSAHTPSADSHIGDPTTTTRRAHDDSHATNDTVVTASVETPPRWIPDEEAAQCMGCAQTFTTFRRRHHCRNCGGVFCGVCSNSQAPLPKFGLNKAVRVCRNCYSLSISSHTAIGISANNSSSTSAT